MRKGCETLRLVSYPFFHKQHGSELEPGSGSKVNFFKFLCVAEGGEIREVQKLVEPRGIEPLTS